MPPGRVAQVRASPGPSPALDSEEMPLSWPRPLPGRSTKSGALLAQDNPGAAGVSRHSQAENGRHPILSKNRSGRDLPPSSPYPWLSEAYAAVSAIVLPIPSSEGDHNQVGIKTYFTPSPRHGRGVLHLLPFIIHPQLFLSSWGKTLILLKLYGYFQDQ